MLSLIVLIAAGLVTSSSAVLRLPWPATRDCRRRRFEDNVPLQICAGILALGSVLLAVHVQLGTFQ
ncbi:hypothetical protein [Arthrobacter oryzae]|uniref:hypothetical protein n=1 Tax=Arthrobacter oryzae TaxID=409290 RepID=UPI002866CAEA|nr:hypothetical protein [Arthrobacter oryzae]MDR6508985.1 hypothetical protein [Arthrobacter oryzae]